MQQRDREAQVAGDRGLSCHQRNQLLVDLVVAAVQVVRLSDDPIAERCIALSHGGHRSPQRVPYRRQSCEGAALDLAQGLVKRRSYDMAVADVLGLDDRHRCLAATRRQGPQTTAGTRSRSTADGARWHRRHSTS